MNGLILGQINPNLVDAYNPNGTYQSGEYCIKNDILYKANQNIDAPEEFTAEHWTKTTVGKEINDIYTKLLSLMANNGITSQQIVTSLPEDAADNPTTVYWIVEE